MSGSTSGPERPTQRWTRGVVGRYLLFQIPEAAVGAIVIALLLDWQAITTSTAWLLFGIWIGKDVVLFPFVYRAYEPGSEAAKLPMRLLGSVAVTTAPISASGTGRVRLGAELWNARLASGAGSVVTDEEVRVTALEGLTLVVEPITSVSRPR